MFGCVMKKSSATTLWLLLAAVMPVDGQSPNPQSYPFAPYSAEGLYKGRTATPKLFTVRDGAFRFSYPNDFQVCTQGKMDPCIHSYIPVCGQDAFVCVVYPAQEFRDTTFGAVSFQVREILRERETMTPDVCVTPYPRKDPGGITDWPEFLISAKDPQEMIGGMQFLHGVSDGVAMSNSISVDLYRAFHKQRCFELSVSQTGSNPNVYDPPRRTLTPAQQKKVDQTMSEILHSFRFSE